MADGYEENRKTSKILRYLHEVHEEIDRATKKYGPINSAHEAYGIIKEEIDEMWDEIKANDNDKARQEAVQAAAMCIRLLVDSEEWGKKDVQDSKGTS